MPVVITVGLAQYKAGGRVAKALGINPKVKCKCYLGVGNCSGPKGLLAGVIKNIGKFGATKAYGAITNKNKVRIDRKDTGFILYEWTEPKKIKAKKPNINIRVKCIVASSGLGLPDYIATISCKCLTYILKIPPYCI